MRALGKGVVVMFAVIGVVSAIQQLRGQGTASLEGATLAHVGIVTPDIMKTAQVFAELYGITPPATPRIYDNSGKGLALPPGVVWNRAAKAKIMQLALGSIPVELLEPIDGPSPWADHLAKHGMSVHHIAFRVEKPEQVRRTLELKGGRWVMGEGGDNMAYVDMRNQLGYTVEVLPLQRAGAPAAPPVPPAPGK